MDSKQDSTMSAKHETVLGNDNTEMKETQKLFKCPKCDNKTSKNHIFISIDDPKFDSKYTVQYDNETWYLN